MRRKEKHRLIPCVWMDYCFAALEGEMLSVLVVLEETSGAVESAAVLEKGPADFPMNSVIEALNGWGIQKAIFYTDQRTARITLIYFLGLFGVRYFKSEVSRRN